MWLIAFSTAQLGCSRRKLFGDLRLANRKAGDHCAIFLQCVSIRIGMRNHYRVNSRLKAVAMRTVTRLQTQRFYRHYITTV